jgi:alanyl-tRNA synthetase
MQQHTGQHILSQAFLRIARAPTLSFHLGLNSSTIDVDLASPSEALMAEIERAATRIVFENRAVRSLKVTREQQEDLGVRKPSDRDGAIRVIEIEDYDRSPCGGTHVRRTGEIGVIAILGCERYKGGARIEFVCGTRALERLRIDHELLAQMGSLFSAHPEDLPRLTEKLLKERSALARENSQLRSRIFESEAQEILHRADKLEGIAMIGRIFADRTIDEVRLLAQKITAGAPAVVILGTSHETCQLVAARSPGVPGHCGEAVKKTAGNLGGRGGGKPELAQAGGIPPSDLKGWIEALEEHFRACIAEGTAEREGEPRRTCWNGT